MCTTTFAALLGLAVGCGVNPSAGGPGGLLTPLDPRVETRWRPPPSPIAGLKPYAPVDARIDRGGSLAPIDASPALRSPAADTRTMPGMSMPGTSMPGMSKP